MGNTQTMGLATSDEYEYARSRPAYSRVAPRGQVEDLLVSLSIETSTLPDGVLQIVLRGEIDVDTAHEVRDIFAAALTQGRPTRIELNLRRVSFIDSVGISALVAGFQTAEVSGVKLVVVEPSRFVHRQLWVTGLLGLFGAPEPYLGGVDATPEAGVR